MVEIDVDAVCDGKDVLIGAIMEHIEEAGIHSGDSACVTPPYSLSDELIEKLKVTPFEELLKPRHADDPEKRPVLMWVLGDTTEHFAEHRATIEKML